MKKEKLFFMGKRAQLSIIAALLVAVILVASVIITYSVIRNSPIQESPYAMSAVDEVNFAIKQILGFTVGYYGSILQVTGNYSYAQNLAKSYLQSGFIYIANMHPDWGPSFSFESFNVKTYWYTGLSYSRGSVSVSYNLTGLGIYGIRYDPSCKLEVKIIDVSNNQVRMEIDQDKEASSLTLTKENFSFYSYVYSNSSWVLINPRQEPLVFINGTYVIDIPVPEVNPESFVVQVNDPRGIMVVASSFTRYTHLLSWNQTLYSSLQDDTIVVEFLQNGTMRWLGQNIQLTTSAVPIPPIPVKAFHVNQTINGVNREVPFQIEDWASEYKVPLGLSSNASIFSSRHMIVTLVNHNVEKITVWWDHDDTAVQTPYAYTNRYFTNDDVNNPSDAFLSNGRLSLRFYRTSSEYLYVDGFNSTSIQWDTVGSSPYLNDNTSNYIYDDDSNDVIGWFSFQDPTYSGILEVKIQFECRCSGNEYFDFQVSDGIRVYGYYSVSGLPQNYGWLERDLSSVLNTWEKIANAKIRIRYRYNSGTASPVYIRRVRLIVSYTTTAWGVKSTLGESTVYAEFMRINGKRPTYGSDPSYVIHHGVIRDIVQAEAEWSSGISGCPNVYSHIVITLPANSTYYTYSLRTIFVTSIQSRTITDLSPIQLRISCAQSAWGGGWGQTMAENGTTAGMPNVVVASNQTILLYNFTDTPTRWMHHWVEFIKNNKGGGIMFTDSSNRMLYTLDNIAGNKAGALKITDSRRDDGQCVTIEFNPVATYSVSFQYALELGWHGAVVSFDNTNPIYKEEAGNKTGLWIIVEYPPIITVSTEK
jgi:hypothetical protein